jgi:hypothetical protein
MFEEPDCLSSLQFTVYTVRLPRDRAGVGAVRPVVLVYALVSILITIVCKADVKARTGHWPHIDFQSARVALLRSSCNSLSGASATSYPSPAKPSGTSRTARGAPTSTEDDLARQYELTREAGPHVLGWLW